MKQVAISEIMYGQTKVQWNDLFDNEFELIGCMMLCTVDDINIYNNVKGYAYIKSFKKYIANNGCLTDKQMTQLKRLAKEIYIHLHTRNLIR